MKKFRIWKFYWARISIWIGPQFRSKQAWLETTERGLNERGSALTPLYLCLPLQVTVDPRLIRRLCYVYQFMYMHTPTHHSARPPGKGRACRVRRRRGCCATHRISHPRLGILALTSSDVHSRHALQCSLEQRSRSTCIVACAGAGRA
jgi:hypothetical protein